MLTVNIMSYKYGHLVAHCVDSLLSQTKVPDVIRVYDDGVGDCKHIKDLYPEVELIERPENLGTTKNFQDALERTTTEYVLFIGADNWLHQDAIRLLSEKKADIICYDIALTGTEKDKFAQRLNTELVDGYLIWEFQYEVTPEQMKSRNRIHGSSMYRTEVAKKYGYIQKGQDKNPQEDWGLFQKMIEGGATYDLVPKPLLFYRRHRENFIK